MIRRRIAIVEAAKQAAVQRVLNGAVRIILIYRGYIRCHKHELGWVVLRRARKDDYGKYYELVDQVW